MKEPKEPEISCPYLDSAIEEIESARKIHSSLREWGNYWKDKLKEDNDLYEEILRIKNEEIEALKDKISDLEKQLTQ